MASITKDTADIIKRGFDWSEVLTAIGGGVTLVTSQWTVTGAGLTVTSEGISAPYTKVLLSGGTASTVYIVSNAVTLSDGQTYERSIEVAVKQHVFI